MASSSKLIVIIGATGSQGGSVVDTFINAPGNWRVRALTRDASSSKAQTLAAKSSKVEVVSANMDDVDSLKSAFRDANVIFGVTDFWTLFGDQSNRSKVPDGQPFIEWAAHRETLQGKNIFEAAASVPGLERLIYSTLANYKKWSGGKYSYALHFDSKALAAEWAEEYLPEVWAKTSQIQVGMYLSNFSNLAMPFFIPKKVCY